MILKIGSKIRFSKSCFINEYKPFRLEEISKIDFNKEYRITELYDAVRHLDTESVSNFIFWVDGINIEFGEEHMNEI